MVPIHIALQENYLTCDNVAVSCVIMSNVQLRETYKKREVSLSLFFACAMCGELWELKYSLLQSVLLFFQGVQWATVMTPQRHILYQYGS